MNKSRYIDWIIHSFKLPFSFVLILIPFFFFAQSNDKKIFDHFGPQEGFHFGQVLCIEKTKNGYLWLGTSTGLIRFDGHNFFPITDPLNIKNSFPGTYIKTMVKDQNDRLWINADADLFIFDTKTHTYTVPTFSDGNQPSCNPKFYYDRSNKKIWVLTNYKLYGSEKNDVLCHETIGNLPPSRLYSMQMTQDGTLWIVSSLGLIEYNPKINTAYVHKEERIKSKNVLLSDLISSYLEGDSVIWMGGWVYGLTKFNIRTKKQENFIWQDKNQNGVIAINVSPLKEESSFLWLATTSGIMTFDRDKNIFHSYHSTDLNDNQSISGSGHSFFLSNMDGLWIGTDNGLHLYNAQKQSIKTYQLNIPTNYQYNWLSHLCFDHSQGKDSIVYLSILYGDIIKYDLCNQTVYSPPKSIAKMFSSESGISMMDIDQKNRLWICTDKYGLIKYDLGNNTTQHIHLEQNNKSENQIHHITENNSHLWFASRNKVFKYNNLSQKLIHIEDVYSYLIKYLPDSYISNISLNPDNELWMILKSNNNKVDKILIYNTIKVGEAAISTLHLPEFEWMKDLNSISPWSKKEMIITSFQGITFIDYDKIISSRYINTNLNQPIGFLRFIAPQDNNICWFSHTTGVYMYNKKENVFTTFNSSNSLIGKKANPYIFFSKYSQTLYVEQNNSFNTIHLTKRNKMIEDTVVLTTLKINSKIFELQDLKSSELTLSHTQNDIELNFTNFNFCNPKENIFQYKLHSEDEKWNTLENNRLNLVGIGYGKYPIQVRSINSIGIVSAKNFELTITVKPPFWKTGWFNILVLLFITVCIYLIFKYREKEKRKIENIRYSIARDLHDDMGSHLSQVKMLSEIESLKTGSEKNIIITDKLSYIMQNMSEIVWSINPRYDHFMDIVLRIQEFAIQSLEPLDIILDFDVEEHHKKLNPEARRHYYLIFKEAINNILKYSKAKKVTFSIKKSGKNIITSIADDGIGFDPSLIIRGNGLKNMTDRATKLGGILDIVTGEQGTSISLTIQN